MYKEVKPSQNSKHGLSEWISLRMESQLEKGHHLMAHYGNTGMGTQLADTLILRGVTETNTKVRFKSSSKDPRLPSHLEDLPLFLDESELHYINQRLREVSLDPVFEDVSSPLPPDNGEVFLSEYFFQQMERNAQGEKTLDTTCNKCICPGCVGFTFTITKKTAKTNVNHVVGVVGQTPTTATQPSATTAKRPLAANPLLLAANASNVQETSDTAPPPPRAQRVDSRKRAKQGTAKSARKTSSHQQNVCEAVELPTNKAIWEHQPHKATWEEHQPFFTATNLFPNTIMLPHGNIPAQYYFPYCPAWRNAQPFQTFSGRQQSNNYASPGQQGTRGAVASPFMNLYQG